MRSTFGKITSFLYATGQTLAETIDTTLSIDFLGSSRKNLALAGSIGALTGVIEFLTSYYFQGKEIRKRLSDARHLTDEEEEQLQDFLNEASTAKKSSYLTVKYGYIASSFAMDYLRICLLYSAGKAWTEDLINNEGAPLVQITPAEGVSLFVYFVLLDLPIIMFAEMPETCKGIRELFKIPADNAPDNAFMNKLFTVVKPVAKNNAWRKTIRTTSSIADTFEHVAPLVFIVPPTWILQIARGPAVLAWGIMGASSLLLIVVSSTIFSQTYLFEGKYMDDNLKKIASQLGNEVKDDQPWIPSFPARLFHYLLYLGGPLHGVDTGLPVLLALRELEAPPILTQLVPICSFLIAWMGNHYSEVMESQDALKAITLPKQSPSPPLVLLPRVNSFFFKDSGSMEHEVTPYGTISSHQDLPLYFPDYEAENIQEGKAQLS